MAKMSVQSTDISKIIDELTKWVDSYDSSKLIKILSSTKVEPLAIDAAISANKLDEIFDDFLPVVNMMEKIICIS
ncbi:hypothetical protein FACS189442_6530 [Spirochaetia bacterium]|nr:hypothetical protein FACS189442_6530 [Spirochaetia bacterium]